MPRRTELLALIALVALVGCELAESFPVDLSRGEQRECVEGEELARSPGPGQPGCLDRISETVQLN